LEGYLEWFVWMYPNTENALVLFSELNSLTLFISCYYSFSGS
jgi:hypothetical protein